MRAVVNYFQEHARAQTLRSLSLSLSHSHTRTHSRTQSVARSLPLSLSRSLCLARALSQGRLGWPKTEQDPTQMLIFLSFSVETSQRADRRSSVAVAVSQSQRSRRCRSRFAFVSYRIVSYRFVSFQHCSQYVRLRSELKFVFKKDMPSVE